MDYKEKVMAYANVIQVFSDSRMDIVTALEGKITQSSGDAERQDFWKEVQGRVYRNNYYSEITNMIHLEKYNSNNIQSAPIISNLVRSPNLLDWIHLLPRFEEEVAFVMDYQKENYIMEKASDAQAFQACLGSLQFFNDALKSGKSLEQLFEYIPLVTWSVESLLATKQLHKDFQSFLMESFVPVLRAHNAAVMVFLDLLNRETEYLKEAEMQKRELSQSSLFTRDYEPEHINLYIPEDPSKIDPSVQDPYLDAFSRSLMVIFKGGKIEGPRADQAKREWHFTPLSNLYRLRIFTDKLGCTDSYTPVVSPKVLSNASNIVYAHLKCYNERNLLEASILGIENVIMDSQKTEFKEFAVNRFYDMLKSLEEDLQNLLSEGLVTAQGVAETLHRIKVRGEIYGLYFPSH